MALVTGSNRGIGLAIAEGLADAWDGDIFITSRNKQKGEEVSILVIKHKLIWNIKFDNTLQLILL